MDGGPWWATVHGVAKSWTRLSDFTFFHFHALEKEMATLYERHQKSTDIKNSLLDSVGAGKGGMI